MLLRLLFSFISISFIGADLEASDSYASPFNGDLPLKNVLRLSPRAFAKLTGTHMNFEQRLAFRALKPSMRKAIRQDSNITVRQFFDKHDEHEGGHAVLVILLLLILFGFLLFLVTFKD